MRNALFILVGFLPFILGLSSGDFAPNFSIKNQDGLEVKLNDYKGKFVLLYFYPKDDTSGCTKEAQNFRDQYSEIKNLNAVVFGVSRQDSASHKAFKEKHQLPFDLLVDSDRKLADQFDIGSIPIIGFTSRESVLIGPDRKIIRIYKDVAPEKHTQEVIGDIKNATSFKKSKSK
jgi:peroxiredoxin Q/BCP